MDTVDIKALNERIQQESSFVDMINMEMNKVIVGQKHFQRAHFIGRCSRPGKNLGHQYAGNYD